MDKVKLGFVPTRRSIFSAPDAVKYRGLTAERLRELGVDFVDIDDINDEGLLFDDSHIAPIVAKFREAGVDGIMLCHANFGTEYLCARLAKELGLPVLLWGPRDERPEPDGTRLRDSQCGLFATGKVLRRFQVPFTYMTNCRLTDPEFERGVWDFLAVCNVVKTFRNTRILQMSTRPFDFWSTMCNEGELLEKFNIQLSPIPMTELVQAVRAAQADALAMEAMLAHIRDSFEICIPDEKVPEVAGLAIAMKRLVEKYGCNAGAIQCWNALQDELGIMPCAANAILNEMGIPIVCETDIHGAITALLVEAADLGRHRGMFADWTVRHPDNENGELLQHCGPWPCSVACAKPKLTYPWPSTTPAPLPPRPSTATSPWPASTATTASTRCSLATPAASTARPAWAPTCGLRSTTSSALRPRSSRAPTSTTAWPSTPTWSPFSMRPASTWASRRTFTIPSKKTSRLI